MLTEFTEYSYIMHIPTHAADKTGAKSPPRTARIEKSCSPKNGWFSRGQHHIIEKRRFGEDSSAEARRWKFRQTGIFTSGLSNTTYGDSVDKFFVRTIVKAATRNGDCGFRRIFCLYVPIKKWGARKGFPHFQTLIGRKTKVLSSIMRCCLNLTIQAVPIHFLFSGQLSKTDTHKSINLFAWKRIHNNGYV